MKALHVSVTTMQRACMVGAAAAGGTYLKYHTEAPPLEADFPRDWQPDYLDDYWRQRPCHVWARCFEVAWVMGPVAAKCGLDMGFRSSRDSDVVRARASEFRHALTRLGPAFIKLGQALSIRPDVLPIEAIEELRKLCDSVPEIPTEIALSTVRAELNGQDPAEVFLDLDHTTSPIAAASLGQVYRCRLKTSGQTVAIKVQRPDVVAAVALDLILLRRWAHFVEGVKRRISQQRAYDVALVESFGRGAWGELDYGAEAENQSRMAQALARAASRRLRNQVVVPDVRIATRKLLVTDWIHGDQLCRASPELIKRLVPLGVELFIWQLLDFGEYHCDPHPGNLLVDNQGRLALIDFGLCCRIERPNCEAMTKAVVHLIQGNVPGLLEDAVCLDFLPPDVDRESLLPVLQKIFDNAQLAADNSEIDTASRFQSVSNRRKQFFAVSNELNSVFFEYPFSVPDYFALITRALIILEGSLIVLLLDTQKSFACSRHEQIVRAQVLRLQATLLSTYLARLTPTRCDARMIFSVLVALLKLRMLRDVGSVCLQYALSVRRDDRLRCSCGLLIYSALGKIKMLLYEQRSSNVVCRSFWDGGAKCARCSETTLLSLPAEYADERKLQMTKTSSKYILRLMWRNYAAIVIMCRLITCIGALFKVLICGPAMVLTFPPLQGATTSGL